MSKAPNQRPPRLRIGLAMILTSLLTSAALCGDKTGVNPQMLIQQQACVQNIQQGDF